MLTLNGNNSFFLASFYPFITIWWNLACPNLNFFHVVYIKGHWARLRRHFIGLLAWGLLVWPCKVSKPWDFCFAPLERCGIWQKYYLNTCQILKRNDKSNYQFCGLISSGGITIKPLIRYWIVWTFFPLTPTHNHAIKSVAHIPESTSPTSHICVHISATKWYILGYLSNAPSNLCHGSILCTRRHSHNSM